MSRWIKSLRALPIANTGSVARDHLANERTFLAWTRTGLGFIALGVALEKLDAMEGMPSPLERHQMKMAATFLVGAGSGCLVHGTLRYFSIMRLLQKGLFRPNMAGVMLVVLTSTGFAVGGTAMVMSRQHQD
ncbi:MAG: hypothetical protein M1827_006548 [Pycnora praestabilis]|nr:MAG: hypothetical protein M1827_006548 [Pycnora praestabilis]